MNSAESGGGWIGVLIFGVLVLLVFTLWPQANWQGVYELPETNRIGVVKFDNKEECISWLRQPHSIPSRAYNLECGKNCDAPTTELGVFRCEETSD